MTERSRPTAGVAVLHREIGCGHSYEWCSVRRVPLEGGVDDLQRRVVIQTASASLTRNTFPTNESHQISDDALLGQVHSFHMREKPCAPQTQT